MTKCNHCGEQFHVSNFQRLRQACDVLLYCGKRECQNARRRAWWRRKYATGARKP